MPCLVPPSRFIPTGVGNIGDHPAFLPDSTVHPHRRGEHASVKLELSKGIGSSPQAWGTFLIGLELFLKFRFIPTGVGNIFLSNRKTSSNAVHPHRRGEHPPASWRFLPVGGSSPQAWGTSQHRNRCSDKARFIPTGVGNMPSDYRRDWAKAVHPHRRGEHLTLRIVLMYPIGSSPQAWGTWSLCERSEEKGRFIPTGVGNMWVDLF